LSANDLRALLAAHGYQPAVGIHVIYELARAFRPDNRRGIAERLFTILRDLEPAYQQPADWLLSQEVIRLRTGSAVLPFLGHLDATMVKTEVARLAAGYFDERADRFITTREQSKRLEFPVLASNYISRMRTGDARRLPKTYEELLQVASDDYPDIVLEILRPINRVSVGEARELSARLDSFPGIRTTVRANLYLSFICLAYGEKPGFDKLDDYRHVIEASYCDALVVEDTQLGKTAPRLNPELSIVPWAGLQIHE